MCDVLFGDLTSAGLVYHLDCDDPRDRASHLMDWLAQGTSTPDDTTVLAQVIGSMAVRARLVVIESEYFDVDYRSEFSRTFATAFEARYYGLSRLHFFQVATDSIPQTRFLRDFVFEIAKQIADSGSAYSGTDCGNSQDRHSETTDYLGYLILRPQLTGCVGRSVLAPIAEIPTVSSHVPPGRLIRTIASEPINLFGIQLLAIGIPFMEQDGHLLRCAHVSIWICHYSSWMRGLTTRRTTGYIHTKASDAEPGRTYPSSGLSIEAIKTVLDDVGLPPEEGETFGLARPRRFTWADRTEFIEEIQELEILWTEAKTRLEKLGQENSGDRLRGEQLVAARAVEDAATALNERWTHENLSAMICRYLNSSTPSILVREGLRHTQVVVGYMRNEDRAVPPPGHRSDVTAFIVSDDLAGPFEVVDIETIVREVTAGETSVVTPLPRSLWLTGDFAERSAIAWFSLHAGDLNSMAEGMGATSAYEMSEDFRKFFDAVCGGRPDLYAIRSYWTQAVDFKIDIADDTRFAGCPGLVRTVGEMSMPKFIWVSEVIDRELRANNEPSVVASLAISGAAVGIELALDADIGDRLVPLPSDVLPLFVQLPGWFKVFDPTVVREDAWTPGPGKAYATGRWSAEWRPNYTVDRLAARWKVTDHS